MRLNWRGAVRAGALTLLGLWPVAVGAQQRPNPADSVPTLGLEGGRVSFQTPAFQVELVKASQTLAGLRPLGSTFDFTPSDWLERRDSDGFYHLGDLNLRVRPAGAAEWTRYSTAAKRKPVESLPATSPVLAAADLAATLPADIPLQVRRYWEVDGGQLALRFELKNRSGTPVEIGSLGIPLVFNNILEGRSLDSAHAVASFSDPYIGNDAGYVQVVRLSGHGPALLVVPQGKTPLEAYSPLLGDPTRRGVTFEGFFEWMPHSQAHAQDEWKSAQPWNPATSVTLAPGETRSYGLRFLPSPEIRALETTLADAGRPVAVGLPGYVLPQDVNAALFLKHRSPIQSIDVEPAGALVLKAEGQTPGQWQRYQVRGQQWGRARVTVSYQDGTQQTIHYKVIKPSAQVVSDMGRFLTTEAWYVNPNDPFGRSPSVITYDIEQRKQVTEDPRAWVAGLGDEGGGGAWVAAIMKQLVQPDRAELAKMEQFVDSVVWGGLQYADGPLKYGVRKSMFFYQPDSMPAGTYSSNVRYGGWMSWNKEHAATVGRSYNYPHVAALHWVMYRMARNHQGLVKNHPWQWYLERAYATSQAMMQHAAHYAQYGQMEGTIFIAILEDLKREGWTEQAAALENTMRLRANVWKALGYPFGSEMPWDSTGQEEVYGWSRYFGFDDKALVTLNAILAYMPTVPHWGYNGSARRYWDFQYAGKLQRLERQLHHYGSGLNAIPVLAEYRLKPDDFYLLRVGYAGAVGAIANITEEGFPPAAFHSYPSTLKIDGITGDYGMNFFGHAFNTGTYVAQHPEFGWTAFGGEVAMQGQTPTVRPNDAMRQRVYLAPLGLWLTLDAGTFESVTIEGKAVRVRLSPATQFTPAARLRVEQPAKVAGVGSYAPAKKLNSERGAYVVKLGKNATEVVLQPQP